LDPLLGGTISFCRPSAPTTRRCPSGTVHRRFQLMGCALTVEVVYFDVLRVGPDHKFRRVGGFGGASGNFEISYWSSRGGAVGLSRVLGQMELDEMERFLEGRTALVTGSVQGIGMAIAKALASAGARIGVHGIATPQESAPVMEEMRKCGAPEA